MIPDWKTAEEHRITEDSLIVKLTKGVVALGLVGIFAWLLWQMTTPAGLAFFYKLAGG